MMRESPVIVVNGYVIAAGGKRLSRPRPLLCELCACAAGKREEVRMYASAPVNAWRVLVVCLPCAVAVARCDRMPAPLPVRRGAGPGGRLRRFAPADGALGTGHPVTISDREALRRHLARTRPTNPWRGVRG